MRVATGGISHETSTFTTVPTTRRDFAARSGYLRGGEMLDKFRGVNTPIGGFIASAAENDFELVPLFLPKPGRVDLYREQISMSC